MNAKCTQHKQSSQSKHESRTNKRNVAPMKRPMKRSFSFSPRQAAAIRRVDNALRRVDKKSSCTSCSESAGEDDPEVNNKKMKDKEVRNNKVTGNEVKDTQVKDKEVKAGSEVKDNQVKDSQAEDGHVY